MNVTKLENAKLSNDEEPIGEKPNDGKSPGEQSGPTNQAPRNLTYFDDRTALHLTQAFSQETELQPLLALLFSQLRATGNLSGMQYTYKPLGIDLNFGERQRHNADYNLSFRETQMGKLVMYFAQSQNEANLQTCEDLISMAFISLRNCITVLTLRNQQTANISPAEQKVLAAKAPLQKEEKTDALILLALDDYPAIKTRDGEEWAQVLMSSVHEQVREGLRNADGVYHIGDDLIAVLLPHTTGSQAADVAKKVRTLIASLHLRGGEINHQLTACMGLSDATTAETAEQVMEHAKLALATAQREGTNQISIYRPDPSAGQNLGKEELG